MITCHLTKLETALDHFRKAEPKMKPADAALLVSALSLTGRHATALYDGNQYSWPDDFEKLTKAMVPQMETVNEGIEATTPKRGAKSTADEEPVVVTVGLAPNVSAGEKLLEGRNDLKAKLSDVLKDGVEFVYTGTDIGWQWALDRANWNTVSGNEISRRIKVKASFTEGAVGIEMGIGGKKRATKKAKAAPKEEKVEEKAEKAEKPTKAAKAEKADKVEAKADKEEAKAEKTTKKKTTKKEVSAAGDKK